MIPMRESLECGEHHLADEFERNALLHLQAQLQAAAVDRKRRREALESAADMEALQQRNVLARLEKVVERLERLAEERVTCIAEGIAAEVVQLPNEQHGQQQLPPAAGCAALPPASVSAAVQAPAAAAAGQAAARHQALPAAATGQEPPVAPAVQAALAADQARAAAAGAARRAAAAGAASRAAAAEAEQCKYLLTTRPLNVAEVWRVFAAAGYGGKPPILQLMRRFGGHGWFKDSGRVHGTAEGNSSRVNAWNPIAAPLPAMRRLCRRGSRRRALATPTVRQLAVALKGEKRDARSFDAIIKAAVSVW